MAVTVKALIEVKSRIDVVGQMRVVTVHGIEQRTAWVALRRVVTQT